MEPLHFSDFARFFEEVHGHPPFRWQTRLLERVVSQRAWPEVIDLPTGAGKTACIDLAVFALALDADSKTPWCPRRIAMVVDRRVVVDQAAQRGRLLARALRQAAKESVATRVKARLSSLSLERAPLRVAVLRGGVPRDDGWTRTPDQPLVIASTVDQLGSRLLFRGYGVSRSMAPVHAGLVGNDILILLDEVHLSRPFQQTLQAIAELRGNDAIEARRHVVSLSATPGDVAATPFRLVEDDRREVLLARRLKTTKPARLQECEGRDCLVDLAAREAAALIDRGHHAVAVVVNRVDTAHQIHHRLQERGLAGVDAELLTGRMRPLDRDDLVRKIESRVAAKPERRAGDEHSLIVVATQCIEAGADFDFDALVTEHASLDALRQRFGRVDRLGEYGRAQGVIIAVREEGKIRKDDPIYGEALDACWRVLRERRGKKKGEQMIDFGVDGLDARLASQSDIAPLLAPKPRAPVLFPAYLDLWAQTAPRPAVDPEVPLFLHGPQTGPADVLVVWRADLDGLDDDEQAIDRIAALPPSTLEAISLPFAVAKRWLEGDTREQPISDVERVALDADTVHSAAEVSLAVRWRGDESVILRPGQLRPGDTIIVSASRGGIRAGSFDPTAKEVVSDLAERAALVGRGRALMRRHRAEAYGLAVDDEDNVSLLESDSAPWLRLLVENLAHCRRFVVEGNEPYIILEGRRHVQLDTEDEVDDETTDEEVSSFVGRSVRLSKHSRDVERWARGFAERLGLPAALVEAIAFSGWLHDVGKADPRFQRLLRDGSALAVLKAQECDLSDWQLAKSAMVPGERRRRIEAARRSGYPKGTRHEVLSLALIERAPDVKREAGKRGVNDLDLVFHLVASHHGWCRPFAPAVLEPSPELSVRLSHGELTLEATAGHGLDRLDAPIADRFFSLIERYGWHGLAWMEAILRLADHRASQEEQEA